MHSTLPAIVAAVSGDWTSTFLEASARSRDESERSDTMGGGRRARVASLERAKSVSLFSPFTSAFFSIKICKHSK